MSRIKTRDNTNEVHVLKRNPRTAEQMRRALVRTKDSMRNQADESKESPNDYAEDRVKQNVENIASYAGVVVSTGVRTAAEAGKNEFKKRIQEKRKADVKTRDYVEAVAETERWKTAELGLEHQSVTAECSLISCFMNLSTDIRMFTTY